MSSAEQRTPADFLFTYRGLLVDYDRVPDRFHELHDAKSLAEKAELTERFIRHASGKGPRGTLAEDQNKALNEFLEDPLVQPILPLASGAPQGLPPHAPGPDELKLIYRMMFATDSTEQDSEFAQFEIAAFEGRFGDIEKQFARLYCSAIGTQREFRLTSKQQEGFKRLTSDTYRPLRPFDVGDRAVY